MIPCPNMRDNAIVLQGTYDNDDLCHDLVGGLLEGYEDRRLENGMLVWSDPWLISGWELTEGFTRKWAALICGCHEMIAATNVWRSIRDEEPLAGES
jgi:hypothetical protein